MANPGVLAIEDRHHHWVTAEICQSVLSVRQKISHWCDNEGLGIIDVTQAISGLVAQVPRQERPKS